MYYQSTFLRCTACIELINLTVPFVIITLHNGLEQSRALNDPGSIYLINDNCRFIDLLLLDDVVQIKKTFAFFLILLLLLQTTKLRNSHWHTRVVWKVNVSGFGIRATPNYFIVIHSPSYIKKNVFTV